MCFVKPCYLDRTCWVLMPFRFPSFALCRFPTDVPYPDLPPRSFLAVFGLITLFSLTADSWLPPDLRPSYEVPPSFFSTVDSVLYRWKMFSFTAAILLWAYDGQHAATSRPTVSASPIGLENSWYSFLLFYPVSFMCLSVISVFPLSNLRVIRGPNAIFVRSHKHDLPDSFNFVSITFSFSQVAWRFQSSPVNLFKKFFIMRIFVVVSSMLVSL